MRTKFQKLSQEHDAAISAALASPVVATPDAVPAERCALGGHAVPLQVKCAATTIRPEEDVDCRGFTCAGRAPRTSE